MVAWAKVTIAFVIHLHIVMMRVIKNVIKNISNRE